VLDACHQYEEAISGWQCPRLFGIGLSCQESDPWFPFVCHGDHPLPAVIFATVVGHPGGSRGYELGSQELDQAINRLAHPLKRAMMLHILIWQHGDCSKGNPMDLRTPS